MDSENLNYAEFTVEKECTGSYKLARIAMKIGLWLPGILLCLIFLMLAIPLWILIIPIYPSIIWPRILKPLFYPYVYIEYEYQVVSGSFRMAKVLGRCKRKELADVSISSALAIAPYSGDYKAAADADDITERLECVSSMKAEEIYYILYEENGDKKVIFFEPINKALKLMSFHNRSTVVTQVRR